MKKIIVLAGPSGVGKTTLATFMINSGLPVEEVRSATTRAPRGDAHDGEYIYLSVFEFLRLAESGEMLEYTEYEGNLYGTPLSEIERISNEGKIPLLILDLNGVDTIKNSDYPSLKVYLFDHKNTLEERLYKRYLGDAPSAEGLSEFIKRKERNLAEFLHIDEISELFDVLVENVKLNEATALIMATYETGKVQTGKDEAILKIKESLKKNEGRE